jgi:phytoene/squalene synthetase
MGRVYLPRAWLDDAHTSAADIVHASQPARDADVDIAATSQAVATCRKRLLRRAHELYVETAPAIERLPRAWGARRGVRCAVESYMQIGAAVEKRLSSSTQVGTVEAPADAKRASVSKWKRAWVAWKALASG